MPLLHILIWYIGSRITWTWYILLILINFDWPLTTSLLILLRNFISLTCVQHIILLQSKSYFLCRRTRKTSSILRSALCWPITRLTRACFRLFNWLQLHTALLLSPWLPQMACASCIPRYGRGIVHLFLNGYWISTFGPRVWTRSASVLYLTIICQIAYLTVISHIL